MWIPVLIAALAAAPVQAPSDTTIRVDRGTRLDVDNHRGEVVIAGWDRDAVRVRSDLSSRQVLEVNTGGSVLRLRPRTIQGGPRDADIVITVPRWMDVRVHGNQVDVDIRGTEAEVSVETVGGDVTVRGGAGLIAIRTVQGEIDVTGATGRVEVLSTNEDITLADIAGDIYVEGTNGDITLRGIRSTSTRVTTVNGDLAYDGTIRDNGRYVFSTHNGDVTLTVPANVNATVSVGTYHGEFESDFPVRLTGTTRDRSFTFTLGSGSARIELESFNGEIRLRRP